MPKEKRKRYTKMAVRMEKKEIILYPKETYTIEEKSPKREYQEKTREQFRKMFENKVKVVNRFFTGHRNEKAFGDAGKVISEFISKYKKEYGEGYQIYLKEGEDGLEEIYDLFRSKLEINFTGEYKKPFKYKIK